MEILLGDFGWETEIDIYGEVCRREVKGAGKGSDIKRRFAEKDSKTHHRERERVIGREKPFGVPRGEIQS